MYERFVGPLHPEEQEAYHAEMREQAALFGVPEAILPKNLSSFRRYVDETVEHLEISDQARALQGVDAAVARRDRYAVLAAQVDRGLRLLEGGHENLGRILVRDES